ncbi:MAG: efflux RND transporter periplasmic adaptor subunit [Alphaproteobacteria bacterium]
MAASPHPLSRAIAILAVAAVACAGAVPAAAQGQPPALVEVDAVIVEPLSQTAPVVGRIVARQSVIAAQVAGVVARVHAVIGDRVARGDLLVELDAARLEAEVAFRRAERDEAAASAVAAEASLALAQQALDRMTGLRDSAAFSQARFEEAEQEVRRARSLLGVARARRMRADANLEKAAIDLEDARVLAPFSGVIGNRAAHVGEYLRVGDPIVTVINDSDLEVEAAVPASRISGMQDGVVVSFTLDDGSRHDAAVRATVPMEDSLTRTRLVRLIPEFGETANEFAGNQSVIVLIPIGVPREVVTVHKDAVLNRQGGRVVYAVVDGLAQFRPVRLGESVGNRFEVLDGLTPGELVVVRGNERLRPGQPVRHDGSS